MLKGLLGKLYRRKPTQEPGEPLNHEVITMSAKRSAPTGKDNKKTAPKKTAAPAKATPAKATTVKATATKTTKPAAKASTTKKAVAPAKIVDKKKAAPTPAKTTPASKVTTKAVTKPASKKAAPVKLVPTPKKGKGKSELAGGISPYQAKKGEDYMNATQQNHFRNLLLAWKSELMQEVDRTVSHMKDEAANFPDPADRATQEEEFSLELRARDRERKLIKKIDSTLELIDQHDYGYCEACGIEIGVERLEVRPTATLCIDCKTLAEIKERQLGA